MGRQKQWARETGDRNKMQERWGTETRDTRDGETETRGKRDGETEKDARVGDRYCGARETATNKGE